MKPIETTYAGIRFRSRLEARWAVFFNHLGFAWQYEAQGYECSMRLFLGMERDGTFNYLPDFWLPDLGLYVEVKGSLTVPETEKLLHAAADLSTNGGIGCHDNGGHDVVVLGPIPPKPHRDELASLRGTSLRDIILSGGRPRTMPLPVRLHMHKGLLHGDPIDFGVPGRHPRCSDQDITIAGDNGETFYGDGSVSAIGRLLLEGAPRSCGIAHQHALDAARSARFEHGQSGGWSA